VVADGLFAQATRAGGLAPGGYDPSDPLGVKLNRLRPRGRAEHRHSVGADGLTGMGRTADAVQPQ